MSPLAQVTEVAQGGGVDEEVTDDHEGSPERLDQILDNRIGKYSSSIPDGCYIPSTCNCRFADSRSQEAISASYHDAFLHVRRHNGLIIESGVVVIT